jgi:lipopolysaccharide/colanic/teichoic acid biosynthesis glycosyltransferase
MKQKFVDSSPPCPPPGGGGAKARSGSKRLFDLLWTIPGLLVLWPFFLLIALWIKLDDGGLVLFRQERVGYEGRPFRIYKFRTMVPEAESLGKPLTIGGRDPRVTRAGYWLRRFKLDELPQLFNVLMGDMSLVGPRPEVPRYVALYTAEQRRVLELLPGITDPASITYRHESEHLANAPDPEQAYIDEIMPDKIRLNLHYAAHATLWSDFQIVVKTVLCALQGWPV